MNIANKKKLRLLLNILLDQIKISETRSFLETSFCLCFLHLCFYFNYCCN